MLFVIVNEINTHSKEKDFQVASKAKANYLPWTRASRNKAQRWMTHKSPGEPRPGTQLQLRKAGGGALTSDEVEFKVESIKQEAERSLFVSTASSPQ